MAKKTFTCRKCDKSFEKQDFLRHKKGPCDLICTVCAEEFKVRLAVINEKLFEIIPINTNLDYLIPKVLPKMICFIYSISDCTIYM